jgi:hypothetical protein
MHRPRHRDRPDRPTASRAARGDPADKSVHRDAVYPIPRRSQVKTGGFRTSHASHHTSTAAQRRSWKCVGAQTPNSLQIFNQPTPTRRQCPIHADSRSQPTPPTRPRRAARPGQPPAHLSRPRGVRQTGWPCSCVRSKPGQKPVKTSTTARSTPTCAPGVRRSCVCGERVRFWRGPGADLAARAVGLPAEMERILRRVVDCVRIVLTPAAGWAVADECDRAPFTP